MSQDEIDRIADSLLNKMSERKQQWWVEPETHYNQHRELEQLLTDYKEVKSLFWKSFLGFAIVGTIAATIIGFGIINLGKYFSR